MTKKSNHKTYKLKQINKVTLKDKIKLEMLKNEISVLRHCKHKNIINLYEVYESTNFVYLIYELLSGQPLINNKTKRPNFEVSDTKTVMGIMASILAFLEENGVVNRDIIPENLILQYNSNFFG